jgi:hypothetical protein
LPKLLRELVIVNEPSIRAESLIQYAAFEWFDRLVEEREPEHDGDPELRALRSHPAETPRFHSAAVQDAVGAIREDARRNRSLEP